MVSMATGPKMRKLVSKVSSTLSKMTFGYMMKQKTPLQFVDSRAVATAKDDVKARAKANEREEKASVALGPRYDGKVKVKERAI